MHAWTDRFCSKPQHSTASIKTSIRAAVVSSMARILVISDSPNLRISLAGILRLASFTVIAASPGEIPHLLNTNAFDLMLFELRTPYESGLKLLLSIRSLYKLPVIVMSATHYPEVRRRALIHGAQAFLQQPVEPELIVHYVRQTLAPESAANLSQIPPSAPLNY